MQELQHIQVTTLGSLLVTTQDTMQVLEPIQEIMPATLAEHTQLTSLGRQ